MNGKEGSQSSICRPNAGFDPESSNVSSVMHGNGFDWDNDVQGQLLSAFNIGFIFGNVVGGPLCGFFGPKRVMAAALFASGLSQLASPEASSQSHWLLFVLQIVQGVCVRISHNQFLKTSNILTKTSFYIQCLPLCVSNVLMPKWIPLQERSRSGSIVTIGANIGSILGSWLSGIINDHIGWQGNFYMNGILALSFGVMWCFLVFDDPGENSKMDTRELIYISSNIIRNEDKVAVKKFPPYIDIFKSVKVWALMRATTLLLCL